MILITGATGFVGKHLISALSSSKCFPIKALTRNKKGRFNDTDVVHYVDGDISDKASLSSFIEPNSTLINLAYANVTSNKEAVDVIKLMTEVCAEKRIKRFIHCSSISVYGRVDGIVTESTPCAPQDSYGQAKLATEQALIEYAHGKFELIILRPSEVFGSGGKTLMALLQSLSERNSLVNYTRSSLFGKRRTHLVPVETLVEAIQFFCTDKRIYNTEIFNVTADHQPLNQFHRLEQLLRQELELPDYWFPVLPIPRVILKSILLLSKRATIDHQVMYSSEKLIKSGFNSSRDFEKSLRKLARTYHENKVVRAIV